MGVRFDSRVGVASHLCADGIAVGLVAGGLADFGGLLVIVALLACGSEFSDTPVSLTRNVRHLMSGSRRLLIVGGIALALWGMGYGLWYAVFASTRR